MRYFERLLITIKISGYFPAAQSIVESAASGVNTLRKSLPLRQEIRLHVPLLTVLSKKLW
ncbi:MAG: hypothetical protein LBU34_04615 [Planctomycetaceae bacterium]|nr:hypothetical protein [Planctomycetaceae bacterium]